MSVKERIIRTLLISPKTTNEITMALGNEDKKYNAVDKDLKTLQSGGFIHYKKKKFLAEQVLLQKPMTLFMKYYA